MLKNYFDSVAKWEDLCRRAADKVTWDDGRRFWLHVASKRCGFCEEFAKAADGCFLHCYHCPLDCHASGSNYGQAYTACRDNDRATCLDASRAMLRQIKSHRDKFGGTE